MKVIGGHLIIIRNGIFFMAMYYIGIKTREDANVNVRILAKIHF